MGIRVRSWLRGLFAAEGGFSFFRGLNGSLPALPGWAPLVLAAVLALPRFAHTTPDSAHYVALAQYFGGEVSREALQPPFAFRWALPWLASRMPVLPPDTALALCSLGSLLLAMVCIQRYLAALGFGRAEQQRGLLVMACSFPTFNYGSAVLTDSAGLLVLAAAALALATRRYLLLGVVVAGGVWVRETALIALPAVWIHLALRREFRCWPAATGITIATLAAAAGARWWFSDLHPYVWYPSWERLGANLARPVSWATVLLTLVPILILAWPGIRRRGELPPATRHVLTALAVPMIALFGWSAVAAFMSGRFAWPLYLVLVPLAAAGNAGPSARPPAAPESGGGAR